jgi:hypothetical protein
VASQGRDDPDHRGCGRVPRDRPAPTPAAGRGPSLPPLGVRQLAANEILFIVHGGRSRRRIRIDSWNWTTPRIREISGVLRARTRLPSKAKKIEQLVPGATRYWERSIVKLFTLIFAGCLLAIIAVVIVFGFMFPMG